MSDTIESMKNDLPKTHLDLLAERLESDIRQKHLGPGERYLTASAAATELGVSRMTAHRVMNLLAERDFLVRQRGRGTFIGPAARSPLSRRKVTHIHMIGCFEGESSANMIPPGLLLPGLRQVIPGAILHTHTFPFDDALWHIEELLGDNCSKDGNPTGLILSLSPREVQQLTAERGIPTVVIGSVFPGISLPRIESDQFEVGKQLLDTAYRLGGRRFTFANREQWRQGDLVAFDGMLTSLTQNGLQPNQIRVRNFPGDEKVTEQILEELIREMCNDRSAPKPAIFCRGTKIAQLLVKTGQSLGFRIPDDFIIVCSRAWSDRTPSPIPSIADVAIIEEAILEIAQMIQDQIDGTSAKMAHRILPVEVVIPEQFISD
jgi:GntR family transcriptional regulator, arabinose operon transcriptional repressor